MPDARREAILDQLRYLVDEAEMLRRVVARVPAAVQEARTLDGTLSLKETLALIATRDAQARLPRLEALAAGHAPEVGAAQSAPSVQEANAQTAEALLDALVSARRRLVACAEALPGDAWARGGFDLLYAAIQEDADVLRTLTQQLFDAQGLGA